MGDVWDRAPPIHQWDLFQAGQRKSEILGASFRKAMQAYMQEFGRDVIVTMLPQKHDNKSFKLLVAGIFDGSSKRRTLLFDSLTGRWSLGSEMPRGIRFWESGKSIYCHGFLYCVTWSHGLPKEECNLETPWSIVRYNVVEDHWSEYPLKSPGNILPQLVEHRGRGFVVQRRFNQDKVEISFAEVREGEPMSMVMFKHWPTGPLSTGPR
jgi:hypothetical protein